MVGRIPLCVTVLCVFLGACASTGSSDNYLKYKKTSKADQYKDASVQLLINQPKPLVFRGVYSGSTDANSSVVMYTGIGGVAGFLGQIAAHGALSSERQNYRQTEIENEANKVIEAYKLHLDGITDHELHSDELHDTFSRFDNEDKGLLAEAKPAFFFAQDLSTITLMMPVEIKEHNSNEIVYQNLIEMTKGLSSNDFPPLPWGEDALLSFKQLLKVMYLEAMNVAHSDFSGKLVLNISAPKSHKFYQGKKLRVERGPVVLQEESYTFIRSLRGWIIGFEMMGRT